MKGVPDLYQVICLSMLSNVLNFTTFHLGIGPTFKHEFFSKGVSVALSVLSIIDIKTPSTLYSNDHNVRKGPKEGTAEKEARAGGGGGALVKYETNESPAKPPFIRF